MSYANAPQGRVMKVFQRKSYSSSYCSLMKVSFPIFASFFFLKKNKVRRESNAQRDREAQPHCFEKRSMGLQNLMLEK